MKIKQILGALAIATMMGVMTMTAQAADSKILNVKPIKPMMRFIPDVVYSQVPSRGFDSILLQMDILKPQKQEKLPAIVYVTGGGLK